MPAIQLFTGCATSEEFGGNDGHCTVLSADEGGNIHGLSMGCGTGKPLKMLAVKAAVKESPAPTVSATFTCGVGKNDFASGVKM